jgi:cytochrome c biogenesis protein CcdA/thiol-disulfide isomerase/thioredoxin
MLLLFLFAFLAGIVTVLSPCVLPVLPAILSASASGGKGRPIGVILGLIISFVFFTLVLTTLVQSFGLSANVLRDIAIAIIAFFGIVLIFPVLSDKFAMLTNSLASFGAQLQAHSRRQQSGWISGFIIGLALGLVWTPCAGPILAAITTLVATQQVSFSVVLLTIAYSLGATLPLLAIAYGGQRVLGFPLLAKHAEGIRQMFGVFMILTAIALILNWDVAFQQSVLDYFPRIEIEKNRWVQEQLQQLRGPSPFTIKTQKQREKGQTEDLPYIAPAPSFKGITAWINSPPLTLSELKGKVVLIDFWTYSCINCIRTFPYLRRWYETYQDKGFVIIGVHTPEFEFEKDENNVKKAVERFHLTYPIAMDNHYQTWQAFYNAYWPAHYLIDQNGIVRDVHFGEGDYLETENAIRSLLHLPLLKEEKVVSPVMEMTPETYLGYQRAEAYSPEIHLVRNERASYNYQGSLPLNGVGLRGEWTVRAESITSDSDESELSLNFKANRVYLVLGGKSSKPIRVDLDGKPLPLAFRTTDMNSEGEIRVQEPRKYDIVDLKGQNGHHLLTLHIPKGIQAYAFTFGMEDPNNLSLMDKS